MKRRKQDTFSSGSLAAPDLEPPESGSSCWQLLFLFLFMPQFNLNVILTSLALSAIFLTRRRRNLDVVCGWGVWMFYAKSAKNPQSRETARSKWERSQRRTTVNFASMLTLLCVVYVCMCEQRDGRIGRIVWRTYTTGSQLKCTTCTTQEPIHCKAHLFFEFLLSFLFVFWHLFGEVVHLPVSAILFLR